MKTYPTQRNSQVTGRRAGALPPSHQIWIVLLIAMHSDVLLGSAGTPLDLSLSTLQPLEAYQATIHHNERGDTQL